MAATVQNNLPRFAVVGHPNKGKSSIVATLAQDDSIYIDRLSGSTTKAQCYPMRVDNTVLYELIDTPGFQRARAVLSWLQQHCNDVSQRSTAIADFYQAHRDDVRFSHELELLKPIIDGAGIIYVVDGSRPYGPEYEAEMEILRWSGKPSLALINPIDNEDYVDEWRNALGQYFKTVRVFNAQTAEYNKRIGLLEVFGQLDPQWQRPLHEAVICLSELRLRQHHQASEVIANCLVEILQYKQSQELPAIAVNSHQAETFLKQTVASQFRSQIKKIESTCRKQVTQIYNYYHLKTDEAALDYLDKDLADLDLFDQSTWYLFGLNKKQLITTATAAGASAGVLIDVGTGGHSLLLGSIVGGVAGGLSAWKFSDKIAKFTIKGLPTGGRTLSYGPITHPNFPFVVLGRALRHQQLICTRTHAARDVLSIDENASSSNVLQSLESSTRTKLMKIFKDVQGFKKVLLHNESLREIIFDLIQAVDQEKSS